MGCLFCIPEKNEEPTESLFLPLLQDTNIQLYRIDSKSSNDSFENSVMEVDSQINGSLSFKQSVSPQPIFESCVEETPPSKLSLLQERLERLEENTQENLRLISDDVHLIYKEISTKKNEETNDDLYNSLDGIPP